MLHRLSIVVTDNTATGSRRVWLEIGGALINPVRGFNRLISGETARVYPNPEDRKPDDFVFRFDVGERIRMKSPTQPWASWHSIEGIQAPLPPTSGGPLPWMRMPELRTYLAP